MEDLEGVGSDSEEMSEAWKMRMMRKMRNVMFE